MRIRRLSWSGDRLVAAVVVRLAMGAGSEMLRMAIRIRRMGFFRVRVEIERNGSTR